MDSAKKKAKLNKSKESRWDRIQKKHLNSVTNSTVDVRKFFGMNFVNEQQLRLLNGNADDNESESQKRWLDPALVMNIRHESIRRTTPKPIKENSYKMDPYKSVQLERLRDHNNCIESKYLDNEINKFKNEISSIRRNNNFQQDDEVKSTTAQLLFKDNQLKCELFDNMKLFESISNGHDFVQQFYQNSLDACQVESTIFIRTELEDKYELDDVRSSSSSSSSSCYIMEIYDNEEETIEKDKPAERCVRFGDVVEVINYEESIIDNNDLIDNNYDFTIELHPKNMVETIATEPLEMIGTKLNKKKTEEISFKIPKLTENFVLPEEPAKPLSNVDPFIITKLHLSTPRNEFKPTENNEHYQNKTDDVIPTSEQIISELFAKEAESKEIQKIILQKYFLRWCHYTTIEKISTDNLAKNNTRIRNIETFLNNIRLEKKKHLNRISDSKVDKQANKKSQPITAVDDNSILLSRKYQNKLKIQQDIIELQKLKLERQERMITELKINKISDDAIESKATIKEELKNVIRNGCAKSRSKARCLQIVGNLKDADDTDEYAKLQARGMPKFLIEMEQRALERNRKHQEAKDKREQLEREKQELRLQVEEMKRQQDEDAKRQRIEELREKRRQEKLLKIQKEQERQKHMENMTKAAQFYRHKLLTKLGMERFKQLIKLKKRNQKKADMFRKYILCKMMFLNWQRHVVAVWLERKRKAVACYDRHVQRVGLNMWKQYLLMQRSKMLVAIDWHEMRLSEHVLRVWDELTKQQKLIEEVKMKQAESHYNWHLKWRVIDHWQRLHTILKIEKETEARRQRWRLKIWELLPDYKPNCDE